MTTVFNLWLRAWVQHKFDARCMQPSNVRFTNGPRHGYQRMQHSQEEHRKVALLPEARTEKANGQQKYCRAMELTLTSLFSRGIHTCSPAFGNHFARNFSCAISCSSKPVHVLQLPSEAALAPLKWACCMAYRKRVRHTVAYLACGFGCQNHSNQSSQAVSWARMFCSCDRCSFLSMFAPHID